LIIVCSECQAQYSVPDAKVRGRKVRVTCKHCSNGIIVDGFALDAPPPPPKPAPAPAPFETVPAIFDALRVAPEDDATRVMRKPQDFSVHDEPTVVGRIPQEALDAERRFAQRTVPPPKDGADEAPVSVTESASTEPPAETEPAPTEPPDSTPPMALPHDVPEQVLDSTQAASPRAIASGRRSLPPSADADLKTLISRAEPPAPALWPWILGAILIVVVLAALAIRH
jgi:predicted Zn finger-like uncharacterized protein